MNRRDAVLVLLAVGVAPLVVQAQQPTEFELVINMKTAKAIGIKIPQSVLLASLQDRLIINPHRSTRRHHESIQHSDGDNGITLLVQNMVEKDVMVFKIELDQLRDTWHRIKLSGGGAGMGTAR